MIFFTYDLVGPKLYVDILDLNLKFQEYFECPGPEDPSDHTVCCDQKCCPLRHIDSVMKVGWNKGGLIEKCAVIIGGHPHSHGHQPHSDHRVRDHRGHSHSLLLHIRLPSI